MKSNIKIIKLNRKHINDILDVENSQDIKILSSKIINENISSKNTFYYGAFIDKKLVGYLCFSYIFENCDIESIVTHSDFTNMSIATNLLNFLFDFCKKNSIHNIFLEVRKSNTKATGLYEKLEFKKITERKKYYNNIEDALIYTKHIN